MGIPWERDRLVRVVETAAVLGLCALAVGGGVLHGGNAGRLTLAVAFGAAMTLPLLGRRRAPLAAATTVFVATWLSAVVLGESGAELGGWVAYVLASYAVGAHSDGRRDRKSVV